ncbi:MAG TPA: hypothetical protein EYH34_11730 [Planctomycetes bacterium]|nr:hypothetical protein [Planctomycetota bacterium]
MMLMRGAGVVVSLTVALVGAGAADEAVKGIPLKPDPPFAIDGDLSDWSDVPGAMTLDRAEQVVWGRGAWTGPADLNGTVWLAWRRDHLFLAADVTDDQLRQTQRGDGIWKGDHIELYLDVSPDREPARDAFGAGQFQWAFSPGNFQSTGDALADCRPEAYCFRPRGTTTRGVKVAARKTETGWTIEAAIPWSVLGVETPTDGMTVHFEIGLSDTDSLEPRQESLMTTSTAAWRHARSRLVAAVLAGTDGAARPRVRRVPVFDEVRLPQGEKKTFVFTAPPVPEGREALLVLQARMDHRKVAGHTPALSVVLNGTVLTGRRLVNKPQRVPARSGAVYSMAAGDRFTTYYAPDFEKPDGHPYYGLLKGVRACLFELRVTDLLREGENELTIQNRAAASVQNPLVVGHGRLEFRMPVAAEKGRRPAPTGPLPVIEPRPRLATDFTIDQPADQPGLLRVTVGGQTFEVRSRFSTPEPKWVNGSNRYFRHERRIEKKPEAVIVRDTFTNLTSENLPLMQRHEVTLGERLKRVWLAGLERPARTGSVSEPANSTTFGATDAAGIGLMAVGDVMRVHVTNYALPGGVLGLADNNLALRPGASYTAEWAIVPADRPDYWRFLNAARRIMDANFLIDGGFCFFRASPRLTEPWTDEQTRNFILFKDAKYVCASIYKHKGRYAHGTLFQQVDHDRYIRAFERRRRLVPGVQNLVYFHCFLDVLDDSPRRFADARVLRPDGSQADYGRPHQRIFFPTESNTYGKAIAKNVDIILDKIKAEGVYWDEHEYSAYRYHYGEPWDGYSCDIDPKRMTIRRLKSSVTLLTEPWRVALAKRILARGPLIGNGAPYTRAMAALRFPCFVETGSITHCARSHLYSPIALGDHLTERSEEDAYGVMLAALDYGCVYHWYHDMNVIPTHHHLTRYMYPITPMELHGGYIIGRERIITKVSGLFGWGDASGHEVHVFDHTGREVPDYKTPLVRRDGKTYSEIRLAEGWSAAIVRRSPKGGTP